MSDQRVSSSREALGRAMECYERGALDEAQRLLADVLGGTPDDAAALHLLAIVKHRAGDAPEALRLMAAAASAQPGAPELLSNYGSMLQAANQDTEALAQYDRALALDPGFALAHCNRGSLLRSLKRWDEALASYRRAASIRPDDPMVHHELGHTLARLGRNEEALASYERALALDPNHVAALFERGTVLAKLDRNEEALASLNGVLAIAPEHVPTLVNRGSALGKLGRGEEALASFERALAVRPDDAIALNNRVNALKDLNRLTQALAACDQLLAMHPNYVEALQNRGSILSRLERYQDALASYDRALALRPGNAALLANHAEGLVKLGRHDEAIAAFERALAADPDELSALRGLADAAVAVCDWQRTERLRPLIEAQLAQGKRPVAPFTYMAYGGPPLLQLECARRNVEARLPARPKPLWTGSRYDHQKVRIAYISADYRAHPVAYLSARLLELHDRNRFEVIGVSVGPPDAGEMRSRLVKAFDRFHDVHGSSNHAAAALLRDAEVDIAVDLSGHTRHARLAILAHRPAPIAVNYLGYPGTLGADFLDYVIADPIVLPLDQEAFFTEKIVHLPDCYLVTDNTRKITDRIPRREEAGLPAAAFAFCCFNTPYKISAVIFDVWMRLLCALPHSVLWLSGRYSEATRNLRSAAAARGVDPARLVFAPQVASNEEHLGRYAAADLFLDTLPFNAHTTASEALWAGLPVLTCKGETFAGRVGASMLDAIGLPDLVTASLPEYEALALRLARDRDLLGSLRARLAAQRPTYPLFDTDRFRRHIESAFLTMWETCRRGEPPRSFRVVAQA